MKKIILGIFGGLFVWVLIFTAFKSSKANSITPITFEPTAYIVGNIDGQQGWMKTGTYDATVSAVSGFTNASGFGFQTQSLRISNAITTGAFGDQTFSPGVDPAGEALTNKHFEASFSVGSTQATQQPGLSISVSPDDGFGGRMSYVRFDDLSDGIHVIFYDVQQPKPCTPSGCANFVLTDVGTIDRSHAHTIKFSMDFVPGFSNDVVKLYVDGVLVKTGTSWEDYYRNDPEQLGNNNTVPTTSKLIFRAGGTAATGTNGNGYLFDNVSLSSSVPPSTVQVHIFKYVNEVQATASNADSTAFPMLTSFNSPNLGIATNAPFNLSPTGWGPTDASYEASFVGSSAGADYSAHEVTGGEVGIRCSDGKPFALVGYTTGNTLAEAQLFANITSDIPTFTDLQSDKFVIVWNAKCFTAPTIKVHILKYLDGVEATSSATNYLFPMTATWNATNIGSGTGNYTLGNNFGGASEPYGADTAAMSTPADYSTSEITDGTSKVLPVGAQCESGKFRLVGYKTSGTGFNEANGSSFISGFPTFNGLNANQYVIVYNETCPTLFTPTSKDQCKNDGWKTFNNPSFKNQGDCVSFVQSSPNAIGNKTK